MWRLWALGNSVCVHRTENHLKKQGPPLRVYFVLLSCCPRGLLHLPESLFEGVLALVETQDALWRSCRSSFFEAGWLLQRWKRWGWMLCAGFSTVDFMAELMYLLCSDCTPVSDWETDVQLLGTWAVPWERSLFKKNCTDTGSKRTAWLGEKDLNVLSLPCRSTGLSRSEP